MPSLSPLLLGLGALALGLFVIVIVLLVRPAPSLPPSGTSMVLFSSSEGVRLATGAEPAGSGVYILAHEAGRDANTQAVLLAHAKAQGWIQRVTAQTRAGLSVESSRTLRRGIHDKVTAVHRAQAAQFGADTMAGTASRMLAASAKRMLGDCSQDGCGICNIMPCSDGDCCVCVNNTCASSCNPSDCPQCPDQCCPDDNCGAPCAGGGGVMCAACETVASNLSDAVCQEGATVLDDLCAEASLFAPLCTGVIEGLCDAIADGANIATACSTVIPGGGCC